MKIRKVEQLNFAQLQGLYEPVLLQFKMKH
jgi:hypothetical protein